MAWPMLLITARSLGIWRGRWLIRPSARLIRAQVVAMFAETLADPHNELRPLVLISLASSRVAERFAPPKELVAMLDEGSAADRAAPVRALGGFFCPLDPWIPTLFRLLEHDEPPVRAACAEVLDRTSPNAALPVSIPALVGGGSPEPTATCGCMLLARSSRWRSDPRAAEAIPALLVILRKSLAGIERHRNRQPNICLTDPDPAGRDD